MVSLPVIAHFAASAFFGNVAFSAMGFGMGICFLFVYQIGAIAGLADCCGLPGLKYAVFIQTIAALVVQPLVLARVGLKKNLRLEMLLTFIPMQFIGTPLGQFLQDYTPSEILKIIVGVVTLAVAFWQIFNIWQILKQAKHPVEYEMVNGGQFYDIDGDDDDEEEKDKPQAFNLICSEESGGEWLGSLIRDRIEGVAVPPRVHINTETFPNFGDLSEDQNYRNMVGAICEYVEKNPVQWNDRNKVRILFDRRQVAKKSRKNRSLDGVIEAILDIYTDLNECETWIWTSARPLGLEANSGSRMKSIYLYQDPRDVCISLRNTTTDSHLYVIAEKWVKEQRTILNIHENNENFYKLNKEALIKDKDRQVENLGDFIKGVTTLQTETHLSSMKDSLEDEKLTKWGTEGGVTEAELLIIESVCRTVMKKQGYQIKSKTLSDYTADQVSEFYQQNEEKAEKKEEELRTTHREKWAKIDSQREVVTRLTCDTLTIPVTLPEDESTGYNKLVVEKKKKKRNLQDMLTSVKNELWPVKPVIVWMCVFGFLSGFLGGLIGVRGPPLIIFFFFFEYPKVQVKANGALVALFNTLVRIITYLAKSPTAEYTELYGHETWFVEEDKYLYIAVAGISLLAGPLGLYLTRYLNKWGYKACLTLLLIVNGITMIVTATLDLKAVQSAT